MFLEQVTDDNPFVGLTDSKIKTPARYVLVETVAVFPRIYLAGVFFINLLYNIGAFLESHGSCPCDFLNVIL